MHPQASRRRVRTATLVLALLTAASAAAADSFIRGGNEFVANTYTPYTQFRPDVASVPDGRFIVVWERIASPDIHGQRFNEGGAKAGGEFVVTGDTQTGFVNEPSVSAAADGSFVVVWEGYSENPYFYGYWIQAQRHSSTGVRLGPQFTVNNTPGTYYRQAVASAPDGAFVVVWSTYGPYSADDTDVRARFFDNTAAPLGSDFFVNTYTTGGQRNPSVARAANGNVVIVWSDPDRDVVMGRRYDGAGVAQGDEFVISASVYSYTFPRAAMGPDGRFVVVWQGPGSDILAQRYDGVGGSVGGAFVVNSQTTGQGVHPDVSVADDGSFAVAWVSGGAYPQDIFARSFDASGVPAGGDFQVNELRHSNSTYFPSLAISGPGDGTFVVTWTSDYGYGYPDPATDIMGARLVSGSVGCTPAPKTPCRGVTVGNHGIFRFKDAVNPKSDRLVWNWVKGEATSPGDFGDPLSNTAFALCLYDASASPQPIAMVRSAAQGPCRKGVLCWTALSNSPTFRYFDGDKMSDGLQQMLLRSGGSGQARIGVRAGGSRLNLPATPLTPPVVVQLQGSNHECWTATYSTLLTNAGGVVRGKPDGP